MAHHDRFRRAQLPSGLTVVGEHVDSVRSLSIGVWVRVGARHESATEAGMSHFLEHMVFKGTRTRDAYQLAMSLESVGGHLDAFTGREVTLFDARALDEDLDLAVEVLADLVLCPRLDPDDVNLRFPTPRLKRSPYRTDDESPRHGQAPTSGHGCVVGSPPARSRSASRRTARRR